MHIKPVINEKYGKLLILEVYVLASPKKQSFCKCLCDCGNEIHLRWSAIRHEKKDSCGCDDKRGNRSIFKIGDRYGRLVILKIFSKKSLPHKSKENYCECICDCGEKTTVPGRYLRSKHRLSCKCLSKRANSEHHAWKGYGEISRTDWNDIRGLRNRRSRELEFNLTIEYLWELFLQQNRKCAISGVDIKFSYKSKKYSSKDRTASLDRIDSTKGYTQGNVQWVHKVVNIMKQSLSDEEFINWCKTIALHNTGVLH